MKSNTEIPQRSKITLICLLSLIVLFTVFSFLLCIATSRLGDHYQAGISAIQLIFNPGWGCLLLGLSCLCLSRHGPWVFTFTMNASWLILGLNLIGLFVLAFGNNTFAAPEPTPWQTVLRSLLHPSLSGSMILYTLFAAALGTLISLLDLGKLKATERAKLARNLLVAWIVAFLIPLALNTVILFSNKEMAFVTVPTLFFGSPIAYLFIRVAHKIQRYRHVLAFCGCTLMSLAMGFLLASERPVLFLIWLAAHLSFGFFAAELITESGQSRSVSNKP